MPSRDRSKTINLGGREVREERENPIKRTHADIDNLTYARFIDREEERTPMEVTGAYFHVNRDRIVLNDCVDDMHAVNRVVRVSDTLSITDELEDHVRDVRRVMNDLPPEEKELKAQLQDYLKGRRAGMRAERKRKAKNLEKRRDIKRH